jgi:hypothetical protein
MAGVELVPAVDGVVVVAPLTVLPPLLVVVVVVWLVLLLPFWLPLLLVLLLLPFSLLFVAFDVVVVEPHAITVAVTYAPTPTNEAILL